MISSGGSFPVGVTFHGNRVYVANTLGGGSVQGFVRTGERLVKVPSWHRDLGLDKAASAVGQISFTPDGSKLVVTTKASGQSIDVFPVGGVHGGPSARPVVTSTPGAVPFGFAFDSAGRIRVTEAGTNSVGTFTVGRDGRLTAKGTVPTGQTATCWAVTAGDDLYVSNAASGTSPATGSAPAAGSPHSATRPPTPARWTRRPPRTAGTCTSRPAPRARWTSSGSARRGTHRDRLGRRTRRRRRRGHRRGLTGTGAPAPRRAPDPYPLSPSFRWHRIQSKVPAGTDYARTCPDRGGPR